MHVPSFVTYGVDKTISPQIGERRDVDVTQAWAIRYVVRAERRPTSHSS